MPSPAVTKPALLLVDDEPGILSALERALEDDFDCVAALGGAAAQEAAGRKVSEGGGPFAAVLCDQRMPGMNGAEFLAWMRQQHPDTSRILLTGYADFDSLVAAINDGGVGYFLAKPWEPAQLEAVVREAVEKHSLILENRSLSEALKRRNLDLERENRSLRQGSAGDEALEALLGNSEPMRRLKERIGALAPSQSTVLVTGESGTGKELVARALHFSGERRGGPFVAQNCAALPESILESELFGYVKGAFTHAVENRAGIVESAHKGTLFLDEIGDMPLSMQAKLLRFLQEGVVTPVGSRSERKVEVRVIAATHRDLEAMVREKTFREDLFYRLNVIPLRTAPLRDRRDDLPLLAARFTAKAAAALKIPAPTLDGSFLEALAAYAWPGNVRELQNAVEYAVNLMGAAPVLTAGHLPDRILDALGSGGSRAGEGMSAESVRPGADGNSDGSLNLEAAVDALEKAHIERALREARHNITQAAKRLGLSRQGLHNKMAKHGFKDAENGETPA